MEWDHFFKTFSTTLHPHTHEQYKSFYLCDSVTSHFVFQCACCVQKINLTHLYHTNWAAVAATTTKFQIFTISFSHTWIHSLAKCSSLYIYLSLCFLSLSLFLPVCVCLSVSHYLSLSITLLCCIFSVSLCIMRNQIDFHNFDQFEPPLPYFTLFFYVFIFVRSFCVYFFVFVTMLCVNHVVRVIRCRITYFFSLLKK